MRSIVPVPNTDKLVSYFPVDLNGIRFYAGLHRRGRSLRIPRVCQFVCVVAIITRGIERYTNR